MKKILVVCSAAATMLLNAATFEENLELANKPIEQVTAANVESVVDACIAVTNSKKIVLCRDKGLVNFEQVASKVAGKPEFAYLLINNAIVSSNDVLRANCFDVVATYLKNGQAISYELPYRLGAFAIECNIAPAKKMAVAKALINSGHAVDAIHLVYNMPRELWKQHRRPAAVYYAYGDDYAAFLRDNFEVVFSAWKNTEPTRFSNGSLVSVYVDGCTYIVQYVRTMHPGRLGECVSKVEKYAKAGQAIYLNQHDVLSDACRAAYLKSGKFGNEKMKIYVAQFCDKRAKNYDATLELYPELSNDNKVKVAMYLGDNDKLIDALKVASDNLDAKTIESTIAPLNSINAGYRTADLRLALMNINKKYTLKLYDDRDTWEPILSKIRAMIDAL